MPIHYYIEQYFEHDPKARISGIEVKNPPLDKRPKVFRVEEKLVDVGTRHVPIRIYTPNNQKAHPLFIFFHGGRFIVGGLEAHDVSCRMICSLSDHKVIAVDYSERPLKDLFYDCYFVTKWVIDHAEQLGGIPHQVSIGGPSFGAFLATSIALQFAISEQYPIYKQILHYPIVDLNHHIHNSNHISRMLFNGKYGIDLGRIQNFLDHRVSYSPLRCKQELLENMPKTLLFVAEYDPLCDEGEAYALKLRKSGVKVKLVRFDGNVHGFLQSFPGSPDYMRGYEITAEFLLEEGNGLA